MSKIYPCCIANAAGCACSCGMSDADVLRRELKIAHRLLREAREYIAKHPVPTVTEAAHGSIVDRIDAITEPRQASNTGVNGQPAAYPGEKP